MQKVKHDFQLANKEMSSGSVYMIQKCFTLNFKLSTACSTLNDSVVSLIQYILKLDRNHADEINLNTHTEHFKNTTICFN